VDFPRQINLTNNTIRLNDENGDFLEGTLSNKEISQIDIDKKEMIIRNQLEFSRKFWQYPIKSSAKKRKKPKDKD